MYRMLVISSVLPFPGDAGQQMRVLNKLKAFRERFDVTFLTFAPQAKVEEVRARLETIVHHAIVLPSLYSSSAVARLRYKAGGMLFALLTSLKESNYIVGRVELTGDRITKAIAERRYDIAVYEYWHAAESVPAVRRMGARCVLDMHDLLWQSYKRHIASKRWIPEPFGNRMVARYKATEEAAWKTFDALIAINRAEQDYVRTEIDSNLRTFYAPMGTDLNDWHYCWSPSSTVRLAYYGGLANPYNQKDALICYRDIMPAVWNKHPDAELWLVGSNPSPELMALADGKRVFVPGFVDRVQDVLGTMSLVLCPFSGTFGFRSRLIEVMALGVPLVVSKDAAYGMDLPHGEGIFHCDTVDEMTETSLRLLADASALHEQSIKARDVVERLYGFHSSYGRLADELRDYLSSGTNGV